MTRRWRLPLVIALALAGLQGCERAPVQTTVTPPQASLPDDTVLRGPAATASPQVATTPAAPQGAPPPVASTPPAAPDTTLPQGAATPAPEATAPQTGVMGAAGSPAPDASSATPARGTPAGTAAPTELQQAYPSAAPASATTAPAKVSSSLPAVRRPGDPQGAALLAQRSLEVPVVGVQPTALSDNYEQGRGSRRHEAIDILAPMGTPVVAVDDGRVARLFTSKPGGLTVYQFDRQQQLAYYYAHLQRYADGLREGMDVRRGDLIGYVGTTGNADAKTPHLHFAVFKLGSPARWWQGAPVNPYPALSRAQPAQQVARR